MISRKLMVEEILSFICSKPNININKKALKVKKRRSKLGSISIKRVFFFERSVSMRSTKIKACKTPKLFCVLFELYDNKNILIKTCLACHNLNSYRPLIDQTVNLIMIIICLSINKIKYLINKIIFTN